MGDLEDGWNDLKRLLIEKRERGSLARHGLQNDREIERETERAKWRGNKD